MGWKVSSIMWQIGSSVFMAALTGVSGTDCTYYGRDLICQGRGRRGEGGTHSVRKGQGE